MRLIRRLLLVAGVIAVAATVAGPTPAVAKPNLCTVDQQAIVTAAFREAEVRIARAIAFIDANPGHKHVTRWFGGTPRKLIRLNLTLIQGGLREGHRPEVACNPPQACEVFAFTRPGRVTLCQRFFDSAEEGQDARFGILIHEISHIAAGMRDAAYQPSAALLLARVDPASAATNADNYEYFVEFLPQ